MRAGTDEWMGQAPYRSDGGSAGLVRLRAMWRCLSGGFAEHSLRALVGALTRCRNGLRFGNRLGGIGLQSGCGQEYTIQD